MPTVGKKGSGRNVDQASRGSNPSANSPGNPGKSMAEKAIPGPTNPGPPISMRKALAKKSIPNKGRNSPGMR